jgi:serine/threonine protein kinase
MSGISTCPNLRNLHHYLRGQSPADEARRLRQHLAECGSCREVMQSFRIEGELPLQPTVRQRGSTASRVPVVRPSALATRPADGPQPPPIPDDIQLLCARFAPPEQEDELGRLGSYRLLEVLGAGGMGVVFRAEDLQLRRPIALKVLKPTLDEDAEPRVRFLREARAAAALEHEHIVTIYHVGEDRGIPYLAMQLLQGETLDARLRREPRLPMLQLLRIGRQIAKGLDAAHARGLVHRDIKPGNIWLESGRDRVKIVDFGLVRTADDQHLTRTGVVMGTPAYMSPEQARGAHVDFRSDLYSLGAVLYHMATGRTPFEAEDTISLLMALTQDQPPPILSLNEQVPPLMAGLVNHLLAKLPEGRPPSARAVVEILSTVEHQVKAALGSGSVPGVQPARRGRPRTAAVVIAAVASAALGFAGFTFGPSLWRLAANEGQLVLTSDDPSARVLVKQNGRTVVEVSSNRTLDLAAGLYEVELADLKKGPSSKGLKLSKKQFALDRGTRVSVHVEEAAQKGQ